MERDILSGKMDLIIKDISLKINSTERGNTLGAMENTIKVTGNITKCMVSAPFLTVMVGIMSENTSMIRKKDKEHLPCQTERNIWDNGRMVNSTGEEFINQNQVSYMWVSGKKVSKSKGL